MKASPFLKWQGSKRRLVPELLKRVPAEFNAYHEPFLGGGALFFALASTRPLFTVETPVYLSDANEELVECYLAVKEGFDSVCLHLGFILERHREDPEGTFKFVKETTGVADAAAAARMIYLNKTCFNGLYRVNKKGLFNSPIGTNGMKAEPKGIYDYHELEQCAIALRNVALINDDFRASMENVGSGDFVFLDPPYAPLSATSNFTAYTKDGFSAQDQAAVRDAALSAKNRGAEVLISNSSADLIRDLYAGPEWKVEEVTVGRTGGTAKGRGSVKELLIS